MLVDLKMSYIKNRASERVSERARESVYVSYNSIIYVYFNLCEVWTIPIPFPKIRFPFASVSLFIF